MKKLIISLAGLLITLILIFIFIIPLWDSLSFLKNNFSAKEVELEQLEARVEKVNYLKKEYQDLGGEIQKLFLALPAEEDIPNLLVQFEALASSNGLILDNINFGQLAKKDPGISVGTGATADFAIESSRTSALRELGVTMNLAGRYVNFKNYLNSLTGNIRSMSIESISFGSSRSSEQSTDTFIFDLTVNVYYQ